MYNFKSGDKVRIKSSGLRTYWYAERIGEEVTIVRRDGSGGWSVKEHQGSWIGEEDIEPVNAFDLKKNPWFIRTGSKEKSKAAQKWLFEQGFSWASGEQHIQCYGEDYLVSDSIGPIFAFDMRLETCGKSAKEIVLEFETVVKSVKYPEVLTEQQKNILLLEETIKKAQEQIEQLKSNSLTQ